MATFNQVVPVADDDNSANNSRRESVDSADTPWVVPKYERRMSARERVEHRSAANRALSGRLQKFAAENSNKKDTSRRSVSEKRQSAVAVPAEPPPPAKTPSFNQRTNLKFRRNSKDGTDFFAPPRQLWSSETVGTPERPGHAFSLTLENKQFDVNILTRKKLF